MTQGYTVSCMLLVAGCLAVQAQEEPPPPPPPLLISVDPPDGSILVEETANRIVVTVQGFENWTNVQIEGTYNNNQNLLFNDAGIAPDEEADDGRFSAELVTPFVGVWSIVTPLEIRAQADVFVEPTDPPQDPPPDPVVSNTTELLEYVIVARPENNLFENAFKFPPEGGTGIGTNNYASLELGEPVHAGQAGADASVWWTWSPNVPGSVLIDLTGTEFNAVLGVYRGLAVDALQEIASSASNPASGPGPYVVFDALAGVTYRIAVAGLTASDLGSYLLRVVPGGEPDTVGPLVTILQPPGETLITGDLLDLSGTAKDPQPHGMGVEAVYVQIAGTAPVLAQGTETWTAQLILPPGTNIVQAFAVDVAGNQGPLDTIVVRYVNPTNDHFEDAIQLMGLAGLISAINGRATVQADEPFHAGNEGGHSIWYGFRAPANGTLVLSTEGSDFDTLLALYTGDALTNLVEVASNDDASPAEPFSRIEATVLSNEVYHIAVDGYGGESGNIEFSYAFVTTDRFYRLDLAQVLGGSVTPPGGLFVENTQLLLTAASGRDFEFLGWDGTVSSTANPLPLKMDSNHQLTARFRVKIYTETFETGGFSPWFLDLPGTVPWQIQEAVVHTGRWAARSGAVPDNGESRMSMLIQLQAGTGSFRYRVSSEAGYDFLEFYLNGNRLGRWSGELPWREFLFPVQAGENVLEWRYIKDVNFSKGLDAAFVDDIYLPLPEASIAAELHLLILPNDQIEIQVAGQPNRSYTIQQSPDGIQWSGVYSGAAPDGILRWTDETTPEVPAARFYRAVTP